MFSPVDFIKNWANVASSTIPIHYLTVRYETMLPSRLNQLFAQSRNVIFKALVSPSSFLRVLSFGTSGGVSGFASTLFGAAICTGSDQQSMLTSRC
jgi:hypothetical protein